jgi:uncharacterized protein YwbE
MAHRVEHDGDDDQARRVFRYVLTKQETHLAPFGIHLRVDCSRVGRIHDNRRTI